MNFKFFIISIILISGFVGTAFVGTAFVGTAFVGTAFAQTTSEEKERDASPAVPYQEEIDEMKNKAVLISMHDGTFVIELFPEDAPHTVNNFLRLVESGFYDGTLFH